MDRRKTILIAAMVNAGLLGVLFVAAFFTQEETSPSEITQKPLSVMNGPLFPNEADTALQQQVAPAPTIHVPVALTSPPLEPISSAPEITHKLPEIAPALPLVSSRIESALLEVTVKKGDSLDKIAKAHHTTVDEIIKMNQLPGSFLKIGQVLRLPDKKSTPSSIAQKPAIEKPAVSGPEYYTVKVGDNPWGIAMKHHIKVEELLKLNHLNEERARKLKPGDRLRIR